MSSDDKLSEIIKFSNAQTSRRNLHRVRCRVCEDGAFKASTLLGQLTVNHEGIWFSEAIEDTHRLAGMEKRISPDQPMIEYEGRLRYGPERLLSNGIRATCSRRHRVGYETQEELVRRVSILTPGKVLFLPAL